MPIEINGAQCSCGAPGHIEAYCASPAILARAKAKLQSGLTPAFEEVLNGNPDELSIKKLFAAARKKDRLALEVVEETARLLAIGLSGVINLLNPHLLVIGGGVADGGAGFVEIVAAEVKARSFDSAIENLRVVKATLGNSAGFIGASILGEER